MANDHYIIGCTDETFGDILCENCKGSEPNSKLCNEIRDGEDNQFIYS